MIPFEHTWPYERYGKDIYFTACPFCGENNVLLPLKPGDLERLTEGVKKLLVLPCCRNRLTLLEADRDSVLANQPLRRLRG